MGPAAGVLLHFGWLQFWRCSTWTATAVVPRHMGIHCSAACPHPVTILGTAAGVLLHFGCSLSIFPVMGGPLYIVDSRMLSFVSLGGALCRTDSCEFRFPTPGRPPSGRLGTTTWWA